MFHSKRDFFRGKLILMFDFLGTVMYRFKKYLKISLNIHCWFAGVKLIWITMMYLNDWLEPFNFLGLRHFWFLEQFKHRAVDKVKGQCHEILTIVFSWFYSIRTLYSYRRVKWVFWNCSTSFLIKSDSVMKCSTLFFHD